MPSVEDQFQFLISCIKHSQAGKVDFGAVATDCGVISKGAAAKRYERLMKQHGIASSPGGTGVKKEAKEAKAPSKRASKKRKLDKVDSDAGDDDEPVKGEVKNEDATAVKTELVKSEAGGVKSEPVKTEQQALGGDGDGGGGVTAGVPTAAMTTTTQPGTSSSASSSFAGANNSQNNDDDDDEVMVVSATEISSSNNNNNNNANILGFSHANHPHHHHPHHYHHHSHAHAHGHSHPHSPAPTPNGIPGIHSFDYATNMGFAPQAPPMIPRTTSNSFPYGFNTSPWFHPHDNTTAAYGHHFWQGMNATPEHQQQQQQQHKGADHDARMDG